MALEPIGGDVARELARAGDGGAMSELVGAWPEAVGTLVAHNAWPARLARDGTLHVATSSSAWAFELAQLAPTVLERLRARLGERAPRSLRFAPGRLPELASATDPSHRPALPVPTREQRESAEALVAGIDNEELRRLVARAAAASLAQRASGRSF